MSDLTPSTNPEATPPEASQQVASQPVASKRRWWRWVVRFALVILLVIAAGVLFLQSTAFEQMVRVRVIEALERSTGARVELREFSVNWPRLEANLGGLVLHGLEPADAPPLFSADWILARWRLISFWNLDADLQLVRVSEPKFNITIADDGRSNLPPLPRRPASDGRWAQQLLAFKIGRLEVVRGELRWNQQRIPLDFHGSKLNLDFDYEPAEGRYSGRFDFSDAVVAAAASAQLTSRGQMEFRLYSDRIEITSLDWRSAKSHLALAGTLTEFESPRFAFHYDLLADQGEAAPFLHSSGWVGDVAWKGEGTLGGGQSEIQGDLLVRTRRNGIAGWNEIPWSARGTLKVARGVAGEVAPRTSGEVAPAEADISTAPRAPWLATIPNLAVNTLGGQLVGSALVSETDRGAATTLELDAQRLSLPLLFEAVSSLPVPLKTLHWSGAISGPLHAQFVNRGQDLRFDTDWEVAAAPIAPAGFSPVSGRLKGEYDGARKRLVTDGSYIDLERTHLAGTGWFEAVDSQMRLTINTANLDETRTLAQLLWSDYREAPIKLDGRASADLGWTGGTQHPRIAGDFHLTDFEFRNTRWDDFSGRLDYQRRADLPAPVSRQQPPLDSRFRSAEAVLAIQSGRLTRGATVLEFDSRMALDRGGFHDDSPFTVEARIRNARTQDLQAVAGRNYPVNGILQGTFNASGTQRDPVGRGSFTLTDGTIYEESFDRLSADLRLEPSGIWTFDPVRFEKSKGVVQGKGSFDQRRDQIRFELSGTGIALESIHALQAARLKLTGAAEGKLSGEGTLDQPQLRGDIRIHDFRFGTTESGTVAISVDSQNERAQWTVSGDLWHGQVRAKGETVLQTPFASTASVDFDGVELAPIVRIFREPPASLGGTVKGTLRAQGNAKQWREMTLSGELSSLEVGVDQLRVHNIGPVPFQYSNNLIRLEQLQLEGPLAQLEASGTIRVGADPALNLNAKGEMDLAGLTSLDPQMEPAGRVELEAQISGSVRRPQWRGRLLLANGSFHYGNFPNGLDRIDGAVRFEGSRGVLENVTASSGGGQLRLSGYVGYGEATGWQFNLAGDGTAVRVRYPAGLSTWITGRINWTGTTQNSTLDGRVVLNRQSVSPQFDLVQSLLQKKDPAAENTLPAVFRNMRLNVEVASASDLRLDTVSTRNLQTNVELRIQGTVANPAWLGRIGILEGEILFAGKRYTVNRGEISFVNPFRFEPLLSLSVQARVQRYDIAMDFSGPPDRLTVTYRSDPPLPTRDILALLVAGNVRDTSLEASTNQPLPQLGADALLSQALQSQIGNRLDRLFGPGRLRVDPQISGIGRSANASIALEQQISDNISVLYVTDVTSTQQQTVQGEWNISPKLSVVGIRDQNGLIGVNFQITLRFR